MLNGPNSPIKPTPAAGYPFYESSPYGPRTLGGGEFYVGIDCAAPTGAVIRAASSDVVQYSGSNAGSAKSSILEIRCPMAV